MSRRRRRGTDGAQDGASWLPDDYGEDQDYPGSGGPGDWREPGGQSWQSDTGSWQAPGPLDQGWQGHPSGPLPTGQPADRHPSGPLPPLPSPGWRERRRGSRRRGAAADDPYPGGGYPGEEYGGDPGSGAFAPPGEYQTGGFPAGDYPSGSYDRGEYQAGDYPAGDYGSGGYPAAADDAGRGFGSPSYQQGTAGRRPYPDDDPEPGYPGRDPGNDPGYPDRGDWYGDVDEPQGWADDDEPANGFLARWARDERRRARGGRPGVSRQGRGRPAGRPAKRKRGGMRRVMPRLFLTVLLMMVLAAGGFGYYLWRSYFHPADYSGPGTGSVVVHVSSGETATAIGQQLQQLGVVASARAFGNAAKASSQGNALEPGYYQLHKHMQASLAFAMLLKPSSRVLYKVLIPEGWRLSRIIATLGQATHNPKGYQQAIKNTAALGLPPYAKGNPEGYLFPATYPVQPGTPPLQVLKSMVTRFNQEAASVNLPAVARHDQVSEHDLIVVASLVQAEGGRVQDFPKIARVIYNRLNQGMQLQLDSTVMYALHSYGILASDQQLRVSSPYNTYRRLGLPPTPIDSPGDAAIRAALHPATGSWLYFVTVDPKARVTKFTSSPSVFAQLRAQLQQNLAHGK